jgi:hypothetical protein
MEWILLMMNHGLQKAHWNGMDIGDGARAEKDFCLSDFLDISIIFFTVLVSFPSL